MFEIKTSGFEGKIGIFEGSRSLGCPTWLQVRDSNPDTILQRDVSYH